MSLFTPIWEREYSYYANKKHFDKALEAVNAMKDQVQLRKVVTKADHPVLVERAVERIDDEDYLKQLALGKIPCREESATLVATRKVQAELQLVIALSNAKNAAYAADRILDQQDLERICAESLSEEARMTAFKKLKDPERILVIGRESKDQKLSDQTIYYANRAIGCCQNPEKLEALALAEPKLAKLAIERIAALTGNADVVMRIVMHPKCSDTAALYACNVIKDAGEMLRIAREAPSRKARQEALAYLLEKDGYQLRKNKEAFILELEAFFTEVALGNFEKSWEAAMHVHNQALVVKIIDGAVRKEAREKAVLNLDDCEALIQMALTDPELCHVAAGRIARLQEKAGAYEGMLERLVLERFDANALASRNDLSEKLKNELVDVMIKIAKQFNDGAVKEKVSIKFAESGIPALQSVANEIACQHEFESYNENYVEDVVSHYRSWDSWRKCKKCGKREFVLHHELWGEEYF